MAQAILAVFRQEGQQGQYGWVIDVDHLWEYGQENEAGVMGPRGIPDDIAAELRSRRTGRKFRMYDDDGELYYSGRIITDEPGTELDFAPLDDFGKPNAGCTEIRYLDDKLEWVVL